MTWLPIQDNNGNIRGIKDAITGQRIVRWDGICDPLTDWGQANARMIVHAPAMLEVLERIVDIEDGPGMGAIGWSEAMDDAREVVKEARGEQ